MSQLADMIVSRVEGAVQDTLSDAARDMTRFIRDALDTPYPPASTEGEPPHRRTGNLRDGVDGEVVHRDGQHSTELRVWSDRVEGDPRVPYTLEYRLHRPYMSLCAAEFFPLIPRRIALGIRSALSGGG